MSRWHGDVVVSGGRQGSASRDAPHSSIDFSELTEDPKAATYPFAALKNVWMTWGLMTGGRTA